MKLEAVEAFIFWTYDPAAWISRLIVRITGRQLPDKSDAWSHMGIGFKLLSGVDIYYEALFSEGFCGPKSFRKLLVFSETGGQLAVENIECIGESEVQQVWENCEALIGKRGYYAWQLFSMWAFERFGRFVGAHVPRSPGRVVCSEIVARLLYPYIDLRDEERAFDEVNPNSAWRKWKQIKKQGH